MIPPIEEHKHLSRVDGIGDLAHFNLFDKYVIQDLKGGAKMFDIESTDQESLVRSLNGGFPIPGMTYTFMYKADKVELVVAEKKSDFFDYVPIVFCMNSYNDHFKGINLNMLPKDARLQFLQAFYETFKDFFAKIEVLTDNNKLAWNKRFVEYMKSGKSKEMIMKFNGRLNANFGFAYRRYNMPFVRNLRMIEYAEWPYIPFYEPKNAFRGMNQKQIHELYGKSR